jgi:beta-lactamase class A
MLARLVFATAAVLLLCGSGIPARADDPQSILHNLSISLRHYAQRAPGRVGIDVIDLTTDSSISYDAGVSMPAASTIKIPVMVEVFKQLLAGNFDLLRRVTLRNSDRDFGWGELCYARAGTSYSVQTLLRKMIDESDNTATNMLIRLVRRHNINRTMYALGLDHTHLTTDIRTNDSSIRYTLRSSAADMASLLSQMAHKTLLNEWSSLEMINLLEGQEHNSLIPEPLPDDLAIAHKTGTLHDTLNDVGVIYETNAPYVLSVMTTNLPALSAGRAFIRDISKMTFEEMSALASLRGEAGLDTDPNNQVPPASPDLPTWTGVPEATPTPPALTGEPEATPSP